MEWLIVTLNMYRDAFARAAVLVAKNWLVLLSVFAYSAIMWLTIPIVVSLGLVGGLILNLVTAACVGSFLYLVEMMVRTTKVSLEDFRRSFVVYVGDVIGVMFVMWVLNLLLAPILMDSQYGVALSIFASIAIFVLFNAVPELIYLGHHSSLALLAESYRFISNNWIEWFPPNLLALAVLYTILALPVAGLGQIGQVAVASLFTYFVMVMRGLLFLELSTSSDRARRFKYRART